ncbi:MAG: DUF2927 domain-containing protein [Planktomarina sp.]
MRNIFLAAAAMLIAACQFSAPLPGTQPIEPSQATPTVHPAPSPQSADLRLHYTRLERQSLAFGQLRTDGAQFGHNLPQSYVNDVFFHLAFSDEVGLQNRPLQKWTTPMQIGMVFGPSVAPSTQSRLSRDMADLAQDLGATTGHSIDFPSQSPNTWVFVVNEGERRALAPTIRQIAPWMRAADMDQIIHLPRANQCMVMTFDLTQKHHRDLAIIIIREELTALGHKACLHEEVAQAMGLSDDSDFARPSIFNDDDQFALLTALDRRLLALLYDPLLPPGTTAETAGLILTPQHETF